AREFADDLRAARASIEELTGCSPAGYRAPAFSISQQAGEWAFPVLAQEGFSYDSSQHDSPRIRGRISGASPLPHALELGEAGTLWEFPLAVWRPRGRSVPVGGASYWALLPARLVLHGLDAAGPLAGLYLHPHELDPLARALRPGLFRRRALASDTVAAYDAPAVLDVGCGSGRIGEFALEAGAAR